MLKTNQHKVFKDILQKFLRAIKLKALMLYKFTYAIPALIHYMWNPFRQRIQILKFLKFWIFSSRYFWDPNLFLSKGTVTVHQRHQYTTIANALNNFIIFAWLCEKMKINIKIQHPSDVWRYFENDTIINTAKQQKNNLKERKEYCHKGPLTVLGLLFNSSEYGHKILSKLSIKDELKNSANQWFEQHIKKENWVAAHYRGTDNIAHKRRYRIDLDSYIAYLKGVLDDQCNIFTCSDRVQFIDKMHEVFPGRVAARDIQRSYDDVPIHKQGHYQQEKDALIDILVLAKLKLIYTNGSAFIDIVRYFNPKIKIVTLNEQGKGRISGNVLPIPKKDLFNKLRIKH